MRFSDSVSEAIVQAFAVLGSEELSDESVQAIAEAVALFLEGAALEAGLMSVCEARQIKRKERKDFFFSLSLFLFFFLLAVVARRGAHGLIALMRGSLKNNLTSGEMLSDLAELGLNKTRSALVEAVFSKHRAQLLQSAVESTLTVNQLEDIDWRFGVTASSSEMDRVGSTFLQMKLKRADKPVANIELSLEQFYQFLGEMEKADAQLKQLL